MVVEAPILTERSISANGDASRYVSAMDSIVDRSDIVALTANYCWALDSGEYERLREVFLPGATAQLGSTFCTGVDDIIDRVSGSLGKYDGSQHLVNTHEIVVDGNTATSRCYVHAQHMRPKGEQPPLFTLGGTYEDELVRTASGWRIRHRVLSSLWETGR